MNDRHDETHLYCPTCRAFHRAKLFEQEGKVVWKVGCPHGERTVEISSDARLFFKFRAQVHPVPKGFRRAFSNCVIHINDNCSLQCPICFADAKTKGWQMSLEEVRAAARRIKAIRPANVMLIGGEPTEHPDFLEIVRIITHEFKLRCSVLTNGVRLGTEPDFAKEAKVAGLAKVSLSFDTFNPETSLVMRGRRDLVQIKLTALERCTEAGLNCGFVTTMCRLNLPEFPRLVEFFIQHADVMSMYEIQCYQDAGRIVPGLESVDREEIVKTLLSSNVIPGLTEEDFRASPAVPAAGYCISPDCGAGMFWIARDQKATPLTKLCRFDDLCASLERMPQGPRLFKWGWFMAILVRFLGWRFLRTLRRWMTPGRISEPRLQLLSISSLMTPEKLDAHRFCRCTNGVLTADGSFCSPCFYYGCRYEREKETRK